MACIITQAAVGTSAVVVAVASVAAGVAGVGAGTAFSSASSWTNHFSTNLE